MWSRSQQFIQSWRWKLRIPEWESKSLEILPDSAALSIRKDFVIIDTR